MQKKPVILVAAILIALSIGYFASRTTGPQPRAPDRPAGYGTGSPGTKPAGK